MNCCGHFEKMRSSLLVSARVFRCRAEPDVRIFVAPICRQHLANILRSLSQELPIQFIACANEVEQIRAPEGVHLIVEHVGQRRAEHALTPSMLGLEQPCPVVPCQGIAPVRFGSAAAGMIAPLDLTTPLRPFLCIAKVACRGRTPCTRDLSAADPRIKRRVGPLNFGLGTHRRSAFPSIQLLAQIYPTSGYLSLAALLPPSAGRVP